MGLRQLRLPAAVLACLWISACASCRPAEDPDGMLYKARPLPLGEWEPNELHCKQPQPNDCQDWRWIQPEGEGRVILEMEADAGAPLELSLRDEADMALETQTTEGTGRARILFNPRLERYYVLVLTAEAKQAYRYRLRAYQERVVEPPKPRFRPVEAMLLEVQNLPGGERRVALGLGDQHGVEVGQRGRLLEDGQSIAEFEIVEVFADGSVARLDGAPSSRITPRTTAEIDLPVEGGRP